MSKKIKYLVPIFYAIVLVFIVVMGSKIIASKYEFTLTKEEVNLSMETPYQISIDADTRKDRDVSKYKFNSKDTKVAEVSKTGLVTPKASGSTEITVKRGTKTEVLKVSVTDVPMDTIELSNNEIVIKSGETYNVSNLIKKSSYSYNYKYISSSDNIVTVDNNGNAKGVSTGKAVITITTNNGVSTDLNVSVINNGVEGSNLSINNNNLIIKVGDETKLSVYVYPENATDKNIVWMSSDSSVLTVDSEGTIKGVSPGKATVTAQ